jgi:hypothetical protein
MKNCPTLLHESETIGRKDGWKKERLNYFFVCYFKQKKKLKDKGRSPKD